MDKTRPTDSLTVKYDIEQDILYLLESGENPLCHVFVGIASHKSRSFG